MIGNALIMKGEKRETDLRGTPLPGLAPAEESTQTETQPETGKEGEGDV
jgi:hypothetical protein